jgi:hypothetical protein
MNRVVLVLSLVTPLLTGMLAGCRPFVDSYESCSFSSDCISADETCLQIFNGTSSDRICTTSCAGDGDCAIDGTGDRGVCSTAGGGGPTCLQRCASDPDCFGTRVCSGGVCLPRPSTPTGTVRNYRSCFASSDCRDAPQCVTFTVTGAGTANICSLTGCRNDDDCPIDARGGRGACLSFDGGTTSACWERCNVRGDCEDTFNWDCVAAIGGISVPPPGVCAPR